MLWGGNKKKLCFQAWRQWTALKQGRKASLGKALNHWQHLNLQQSFRGWRQHIQRRKVRQMQLVSANLCLVMFFPADAALIVECHSSTSQASLVHSIAAIAWVASSPLSTSYSLLHDRKKGVDGSFTQVLLKIPCFQVAATVLEHFRLRRLQLALETWRAWYGRKAYLAAMFNKLQGRGHQQV